jgi:hypothetical protein
MKLQKTWVAALAVAAFTLASCGGGDSYSPPAPAPVPVPVPPTTVTGTAAIGAPIAGSVVAVDINGKVSPAATTSALGAFTVNIAGMTAPFILTITGTAGGQLVTLNSIATTAGQTVNITPLTDLIVSTAAGQPGGSALASLCAPVAGVVPAGCTAALAAATPAKLSAAVAAVTEMIKPINAAGTDPLTGAFVANGTGMDALLDKILVAPAEAQGAMATVTLIATSTALGTVTLPAAAGGAATIPAATPPSAENLAKATAAATVLPEIRACLAAFSALYPATGFVVPSAATVTHFIDSSFSLGATVNQADIVDVLSNASDIAVPGLSLDSPGLSPLDMSPLTTAEIATLTSATSNSLTRVADFVAARNAAGRGAIAFTAGVPSSAWVKIRVSGDAGMANWKMVKTTDTAGCPGGWKIAGTGHVEMHMNARISRNIEPAGNTFSREWAFHISKDDLLAENPAITRIDVRGGGLTTYGDFKTNGSLATKLQLILPTGLDSYMRVADSTGAASGFYGNAEALQSCQDLATISPVPSTLIVTTPCIDETKVAPGKLSVWTLKTADGPVIAFPFQINAVPLSKEFAKANQADLFPTITSVTPAAHAAVPAGTLLDNLVTFNYTQSAVYGSRMDNCSLRLADAAGNQLLYAEQNAMGRETSCTFKTSGLNAHGSNVPMPGNPSESLFQYTGTPASGRIGVAASVLGNMATSSQAY